MAAAERAALLLALRPELQTLVAEHLDACSLLALARVSKACRVAAEDEAVWKSCLHRALLPITRAFFEGRLPEPDNGTTWKRHFFEMERSWKLRAQTSTGRLLVQIRAQRMSGRGPHELSSFWDLTCGRGWESPPEPSATYGVYDVTDFIHQHPGSDLIIHDSILMPDASSVFEMAAHSDHAMRKLATLAVPGLEALPYDQGL